MGRKRRLRSDHLRHRDARVQRLRAASRSELVRFETCRASVAQIQADAVEKVSRCRVQVAEHRACKASNAESAGVGTGIGCALGLLFPPLGLLGCLGGGLTGAAAANNCGDAPLCTTEPQSVVQAVLVEHRRESVPLCGVQPASLSSSDAPLGAWGDAQ